MNNRRDVSKGFSKNQSLWLPWQREVQVGSAPHVTNYACVCVYLLSRVINMQKGKWIHVRSCGKKKRKDFRESAFVFACVICGIFISCDLSFYHPTQFLSSTHKERRKPSHVGTVVLVDKNLHMTALQERSRMQQLPPGERRHL